MYNLTLTVMSELRKKMIQQMELKGYSSRTIKTYTETLIALSKHFNASPSTLSNEQIRDYLHQGLTERKLSKTWCNQNISALKILFCDVLKREWSKIAIPRPRREKKLPVVLSREEVSRIINAPKNIKHRAFLMLTYSAGLRLSEACSIKISDIDSSRMQVRVIQAKGHRDRYSLLSPVALDILRRYWKSYRPVRWLFENKKGQPIPHTTAQHIFRVSLTKSGVKKKVGIHSLRHSFATHLMEQGVSLPIIQQLLGHKSLRTTSVYLHVQQYSIVSVKSPLDTLTL